MDSLSVHNNISYDYTNGNTESIIQQNNYQDNRKENFDFSNVNEIKENMFEVDYNHFKMNQQCKVCGEPAAGFHFGAFTCEGCKSFFGRSYNNLSSISECKNNGECVINKKNRTACKACRLRKCLLVGMSKSGSRYGRRSNWFKIHCLLQEQQQQQQQQQQQAAAAGQTMTSNSLNPGKQQPSIHRTPPPPGSGLPLGLLPPPLLHLPRSKEELMLLGLDDYKHSASPSVSSPESHNSDSSVEVGDGRRHSLPLFPGLIPSAFLPPPGLLFPPGYPPLYPGLLQPANNNNRLIRNHNASASANAAAAAAAAAALAAGSDAFSKRIFLDAVLQSQRSPTPDEVIDTKPVVITPPVVPSPIQDDPMDLSMKGGSSDRGSSPPPGSEASACSDIIDRTPASDDADEESDCDSEHGFKRIKLHHRPTPLDLTTKV